MPPRPGEAQPAHPSERLIIACPSACLSICPSVHSSSMAFVQPPLQQVKGCWHWSRLLGLELWARLESLWCRAKDRPSKAELCRALARV